MTTKKPTAVQQREMAKAVEQYLEQLNDVGSTPRSAEWYEKAILDLTAKLKSEQMTWVQRTKNLQKLHNFERALDLLGEDGEAAFIAIVAEWSELNGVEYATWREMGVPARILREAGM